MALIERTLIMWKVGDRVFGKRQEENIWYPGTVRHIDGQRCYVIFDDGEDALMGQDQLMPVNLKVGDRLFARPGPGRTYAPGTVIGKKGEKLRIRFDDGAQEWTDLAMTHLQPEVSKAEPESEPAPRWEVGQRVLVCWHDLYWYPGAVLSVSGDQYHIFFDDGNQVVTTADRIRPLRLNVGERVWGRWKGGPTYYSGEVTSKNGEVIHIRYDDGDEETTL